MWARKLYARTVDLFLQFLNMNQVLLTNRYQFPQLFCWFVGGIESLARVNIILKKHTKMIATVEIERRIADNRIFSVIVCKFYHR